MTPQSRRWATLAATALLLAAAAGCSHTYDGSNSFYDLHPEYRHDPDYMHPSDDADPRDSKPW